MNDQKPISHLLPGNGLQNSLLVPSLYIDLHDALAKHADRERRITNASARWCLARCVFGMTSDKSGRVLEEMEHYGLVTLRTREYIVLAEGKHDTI
jgi:hypothetical protein